MAQLVARLVRNEKVGGSNPPSSTTGRHPIRMSVFCMPGRWSGAGLLCCSWRRWCSGRCMCRWAAARPRDRHTRAFGSEWSISRPALALPPPTGTAARLSGALHTGGSWCLEARPGTAAAHGHRSLALRTLRCSPHRRPPVCGCVDWLRIHLVCGTKFAQHARNSPKRAISSEQGEFYTAHAMRRGVQGDFCTGSGDVWLVQGEFCRALRHCSKALKSSTGTEARPSRVPLPSTSTKPATYADRLLRYG